MPGGEEISYLVFSGNGFHYLCLHYTHIYSANEDYYFLLVHVLVSWLIFSVLAVNLSAPLWSIDWPKLSMLLVQPYFVVAALFAALLLND